LLWKSLLAAAQLWVLERGWMARTINNEVTACDI
jgi:hypothetical protein